MKLRGIFVREGDDMKKGILLLLALILLLALSVTIASAAEIETGEIHGLCGITLPPEFGGGRMTANGWYAYYPTKDITFLKCIGSLPDGLQPPEVTMKFTADQIDAPYCRLEMTLTTHYFVTVKPDGAVHLVCKFK
jgi:hypothetical protein